MNEIAQEVIKIGSDSIIKPLVTEAVKHLLNSIWKKEVEQGAVVLKAFNDEMVISNYSEKITRDILTFRTLSNDGKNVRLEDVYYPLNVKDEDTGDVFKLSDNETLNYNGVIVISGSAGQGKTTILRKLFLEEIKAKNKLPIFINLRSIDFKNGLTVVDIIVDFFESYGVICNKDDVAFLLQSSRLKIFFDGFDEIYKEKRGFAREVIRSTWNRFNCRAIVTTRPHTEIYKESGFKNLKVELLRPQDINGMLCHTILDEDKRKAVLELIGSKDFFNDALVTPIMVDILTVSFYSLRNNPKTIADFYSSLFRSIMYSHDNQKNWNREKFSDLDVDQLKEVFEVFSFITFMDGEHSFGGEEVINYFKESIRFIDKESGIEYDPEKIMEDIVDGTNLISRDGVDFYIYIHKSVQEYHAAKYVSELEDRRYTYSRLITDLDVAKYNFLKMLKDINPKDFNKYYVKAFINSLAIPLNDYNPQGYDREFIFNKLFEGCYIECFVRNLDFNRSANVMGEPEVVLTAKAIRRVKSYNKMVWLRNFMEPDFYLENIYIMGYDKNTKISLRKPNFIVHKKFKALINSGEFGGYIEDARISTRKVLSAPDIEGYMIKIKIADLYKFDADVTNFDKIYHSYEEMIYYFKGYYESQIKTILNSNKIGKRAMQLLRERKC
ncbi:NACHT domain-containing protein [Pantoea ananatis]|uniref:NACHT domain-containing protein n=1 Tax=Pantoea ananas TaxID=553 RepID=UPI001B30F0C5|nr:NACHT domain-containing protein [Pantoea ananatis]